MCAPLRSVYPARFARPGLRVAPSAPCPSHCAGHSGPGGSRRLRAKPGSPLIPACTEAVCPRLLQCSPLPSPWQPVSCDAVQGLGPGAGARKRASAVGTASPEPCRSPPPAGPCGRSPSWPSGSGPRAPSPWRPGRRRQRGSGTHRWSQDGQALPQTPPGSHRGLQETGRHAPQSDTAAGLWAVPAGISGPGELCLARAGRRLQAEMLGRALDPGAWAMASGSRSLTLALTCEKEVGFWWVGLGALGGDRFLCPVPHLHCSQEGGGRGSSRRRAQPWEPTLTLTGLCPAVAQSLSGGGAPSSGV